MDVQEELPIGMIAASDPPDNITSASPLMMWFAALRIQKLLVAQAVEIE